MPQNNTVHYTSLVFRFAGHIQDVINSIYDVESQFTLPKVYNTACNIRNVYWLQIIICYDGKFLPSGSSDVMYMSLIKQYTA